MKWWAEKRFVRKYEVREFDKYGQIHKAFGYHGEETGYHTTKERSKNALREIIRDNNFHKRRN